MERSGEMIIGEIIHNRLPVEWMRFNMFQADNIYRNIPILVFRLKETAMDEQVKKLENSVESFKGNMTWKVFKDPLSRKGNYLLTLAVMEGMRKECYEKGIYYNEKEYLGNSRYRLYCEQSVSDIPLLAKHIKEHF